MPWLAVWEAREGAADEGWKDYLEGLHDLEKHLLVRPIPETKEIEGWLERITALAKQGDDFVKERKTNFQKQCEKLPLEP